MDQQDNYLHKKFKKQLSIEPRTNNVLCSNNNNNNISKNNNNHLKVIEPQQPEDDSVPTKSTNNSSVFSYAKKSSISTTASSTASSSLSSSPSSTVSVNSVSSGSCNNNNNGSSQLEAGGGDAANSNNPQDISLKSLSLSESSTATAITTAATTSSGGKYVCTYCNLACSKPSVLQKHIRAHTNERPYPCVSCGFSFKTRSNLYKHCRSRTHANRLLGNGGSSAGRLPGQDQEPTPASTEVSPERTQQPKEDIEQQQPAAQPQFNQMKSKPYKPRFHTRDNGENVENEINKPNSDQITMHINEIIDKNNSIVNSEFAGGGGAGVRRRASDVEEAAMLQEPLNLTKSRKRCLSEVSEPSTQKSLIKELLLKNLYADTNMRCPHCKMIFQTVTELELHKMRNCKAITKSGPRYSRSSSVNVASILTQNKNAFDNIPAVFPLKSPGPFLGKTRLVESDKSKSFSFEEGIEISRYSPISYDNRTKRVPVKLFGGEVKITQTSGETKSYKIDGKDHEEAEYIDYKMSENRVVKSTLQSGGTVLQNKVGYGKQQQTDMASKSSAASQPSSTIDLRVDKDPDHIIIKDLPNGTKYPNILDFSQNAVKLLAPNLRQLNLSIPLTRPEPPQLHQNLLTMCETTTTLSISKPKCAPAVTPRILRKEPNGSNILNPLNLLVNGKLVRYVPGMPGPVLAEPPVKLEKPPTITITADLSPAPQPPPPPPPSLKLSPMKHSPPAAPEKKFARPNSLALKPSMSALKQHHGLTPTMFNQILISPDTPRGAKKYNEHFLHGNYFSYLGLKSSTKPVYCTLNKTQPFYVPHFKKLSMYSEWRQQDNKADKMYAAAYDSRQRTQKYTVSGKDIADYIVHSSYKFSVSENGTDKDENGKSNSIFGGYESNDDYTYIRGRGRGRYVCDQCGIRCKKPSMLKKHIRTHSNDRPYTCKHCNFSFKTKGNLTKHMKSKAHTKNYAASSSSNPAQSYPATSDSDTDDSGMDSSDESSTRQEEHEAAYGLLSLSQKSPNSSPTNHNSDHFMNTDQLVHMSKTNYAMNMILDQRSSSNSYRLKIAETTTLSSSADEAHSQYLGKSNPNRPLTYPYTTVCPEGSKMLDSPPREISPPLHHVEESSPEKQPKNIIHFNVIKRYNNPPQPPPPPPTFRNKLDEDVDENDRKRKLEPPQTVAYKLHKNVNEVIDLSKRQNGDSQSSSYSNGHVIPQQQVVLELPQTVIRNGVQDSAPSTSTRVNFYYKNRAPIMNSVQADGATAAPVRKVYYDNSAMETLADVATKQEKLEKNSVAKNVASEFLKLATQNENNPNGVAGNGCSGSAVPSCSTNGDDKSFLANSDLVKSSEENKSCTICSKNFSKPSQLRLHMNIHYLERPFRCESCSVSFRTKGHLQKHERSATHCNKLSSSPATSSSEPRPFKCADCNIAFRIHGHLAKHLRSKMHIMKLECLAKIPFGLYAELERSNSLLTEINTADGDQCLESLKSLAKKVFLNDPGKLTHFEEDKSEAMETDTES